MNIVTRFKSLPISSRRLLGIGILMALVVALPLFIWAVITQRFLFIQHAASGEPSVCIAQNKVITVTPVSDSNGTCHDIQAAVDAVTGDGYTVQIEPGVYDIASTINVVNKNNINITGNPQSGSGATQIMFSINSGGWGFKVNNSTGTIQWLTASGFTPNGLLSIESSAGFTVAYASLHATSSHTMDVYNTSNFNIYNTEIQSSAGALEIGGSNNIVVGNNKIHNAYGGISINDSQNIQLFGNLIYSNRQTGIGVRNIANISANNNTLYNNGTNGIDPAVEATGSISGLVSISNNIVAFNDGGGLHFNGTTSNLTGSFQRNDIYGNSTNYSGVPNQTDQNGNISADPLMDQAGDLFCLKNGSPAIYGNVNNGEYMGYIGSCGNLPPPTATPTPQATGMDVCNLTCGTNYNCQAGLVCYNGFCRNPSCVVNENCTCGTSSPSIHVLSPNGNEVLTQGQHYTISWTGTGVQSYSIYLVNNLGQESLINGVQAPATSYDWVVDSPIMAQTGMHKIKIVDGYGNVVQDSSDSYFTILPLSTPPPTVRPFGILFKFEGVSGDSASLSNVVVRFVSRALDNALGYTTPPIPADYVGNGIYALHFGIWSTDLPAANDYSIVLKGEKHLAVKFCSPSGQTTHCSASMVGDISLPVNPADMVSLNFTGVPLIPGDLYPQDGAAKLEDFAKITALLVKPHSELTAQDLLVGDLNYDGYINILDAFLMRQTLQTRYDEN